MNTEAQEVAIPTVSAAPPSMRSPRIQRTTLSNGLTLLLVERRLLPVVDVQLIFRTGAVADNAVHAGLTSLAVDMFDEGAGDLDAIGIAEAVEDLGASLTASAGWDDIGFGVHAHAERIDAAVRIMADVVLNPTLAQNDFDRKKEQRLAGILQDRDEPRALAARAFSEIVYGAAHPYGMPLHGTAATVTQLSRQQVADFHAHHIHPGNAFIVVVGDVDRDKLVAVLERAFAGWDGEAVGQENLPSPPRATGTTIHVVDRPGAAQSELRIGAVGLARSSPDYFPVILMNTILGGSFTSRLNLNLRQDKGYTYGAGSSFTFRRWAGPFVVSTAVDTQVTADAVRQVMHEIARIRDEPVPAEELARAQSYIALGLPRTFETTADIASHVAELELYGLGDEFYDTFTDRIRAVTAADVQRVARSYLDPAALAVVLAGDFDATSESLRDLGIGPVIRRTSED
jgi:predicted Zn-dependent peptidase